MSLVNQQVIPASIFFIVIWSVLATACFIASIMSFMARMNNFFKSCFILNTIICITRIVAMSIRPHYLIYRDYPSDATYNFFYPIGMGLYFSMFAIVTAEWGRILAKMSSTLSGSSGAMNKVINWTLVFVLAAINIMTIIYVAIRLSDGTSNINSNYFTAFILIVSSIGIVVLIMMIILANRVINLVRQTKTADEIGAQVMIRISGIVVTFTFALMARWIFYIIYVVQPTILATTAGAYIQYVMNLGAEWIACLITFIFCATTLATAWSRARNEGQTSK